MALGSKIVGISLCSLLTGVFCAGQPSGTEEIPTIVVQ